MSGKDLFACVGECMVEVAPAGGGLHRLGFAGDTFNTAWAARRLLPPTVAVRFVSAIGSDWASDEMLAFMRSGGIDVSRIARDEARPVGLYAIRLDESGERFFSYWREGSAATRLAEDRERLASGLSDAGLIFFSGITLAVLTEQGRANLSAVLGAARARGARIAFDPNFRLRLWKDRDAARECFARAFGLSDIVLPTLGDERDLWGDRCAEEAADRLLGLGAREVVIKNGSEAALVAVPGARHLVPAESDVVPVDATGAGDAFNGGYLAARMGDCDPEAAAARAHKLAALAVRTRGALVPVETGGLS